MKVHRTYVLLWGKFSGRQRNEVAHVWGPYYSVVSVLSRSPEEVQLTQTSSWAGENAPINHLSEHLLATFQSCVLCCPLPPCRCRYISPSLGDLPRGTNPAGVVSRPRWNEMARHMPVDDAGVTPCVNCRHLFFFELSFYFFYLLILLFSSVSCWQNIAKGVRTTRCWAKNSCDTFFLYFSRFSRLDVLSFSIYLSGDLCMDNVSVEDMWLERGKVNCSWVFGWLTFRGLIKCYVHIPHPCTIN